MQRLSSNFTIILKLFIPIAWTTFFGLFMIVIFLLDPMDEPFLTSAYFRIGYTLFYVIFLILGYFTLFQLKRVESDHDYLYITSYFKTIRIPLDAVQKVSISNLIIVKLARIHLINKGVFGKKIAFITKQANFQTFLAQNDQLINR